MVEASFRRLKIGNFNVAGFCYSRENLKFTAVTAQMLAARRSPAAAAAAAARSTLTEIGYPVSETGLTSF